MSKLIDLEGQKFGRLTVLGRAKKAENGKLGGPRWLCLCDCGNVRIMAGDSLKKGLTSSCGCLKNELTSARFTTHGLSRTKWYKIAKGIKNRITNPKASNFHNYGGRGLLLYEPWHDVGVFAADLLEMFGKYPPRSTINRIDNKIGYYPDNIRLTDRAKST